MIRVAKFTLYQSHAINLPAIRQEPMRFAAGHEDQQRGDAYSPSHTLLRTLKPGLSLSRDPDCRDGSVPGFFRLETAVQQSQLHRL